MSNFVNELRELKKLLDDGGHRSVLLVTGGASYQQCGAEELLRPVLAGRKTRRIYQFQTNPQKADLQKVLREIEGFDFSAILAVGGGSAMDMAKLVKCFKGHPEMIDAVLHRGAEVSPSDVDLWAVPTTAGSGSEATHFAVLNDGEHKFSVAHPDLLPRKSWILPGVLASVPRGAAAAAGMDAFCQGVESYWSIHSTDVSKAFAREAIELSWRCLEPAVMQKNTQALEQLGMASHLAGKAINLTKTTAPHAVAYALTNHFGLRHGHAVAMTLPGILCYNDGVTDDDLLDSRGVGYVRDVIAEIAGLIDQNSAAAAAEAIRMKMRMLELPTTLREMGHTGDEKREQIIKNGFNPQRVNNNPRRLTEDGLRGILRSLM